MSTKEDNANIVHIAPKISNNGQREIPKSIVPIPAQKHVDIDDDNDDEKKSCNSNNWFKKNIVYICIFIALLVIVIIVIYYFSQKNDKDNYTGKKAKSK